MQRAPLIHDPRFSRSQFLRLTAAGAASIAGAGVLGSAAEQASAQSLGAPKMGGTIRLGQLGDVISFDGPTISDNNSIWTMLLIYDQVTRPTEDGLSIEPGLAESWEISPDGKTYTFHLRKGVKFHDGSPMTAADVKFSVERAVTLKNSQWTFIFIGFKGMTVVDDYTVVAHLDRPRSPFLSDMALFAGSVLPKKLVESEGEKFFQHPIGTGPFMFKSWVKGSQINLVRNPHHFRAPKPYVDAIQQLVVGDDNARVLQVENGELDIALFVPFAQASAIKANPNVVLHQDNFFDSDFITLQNLTPHFSDKYVRQAVNYAVDKNAIVQHILFGYGEPSGQAMPKMFGYTSSIPPYPYNPAMAKSLMAKSKYPNGFTTSLIVDAASAATGKPIAELVQEQLKAIGINVTIQVLDDATAYARSTSKNYEMSIGYMTSDIIDPDELMSFAVVPHGGTNAIWTYYLNPAIDKLAAQAAAITDHAQRQKLYDQINKMYHEDAPMLFLYHTPSLSATSTKLQGFKVLATGNYHLEDCWFSS
jgi:peptide/nickel transport system substrate-binding protein